MRGRLLFLAGFAIGYVLGSRAGRERYEQLTRAARKVRDNPTVQEAAGLVQAHAGRVVSSGRNIVTDKLSHTRIGERFFAHHEPHESHTWPNGTRS